MFDMALKVVPINGIQDLWIHVSKHVIAKNYTFLVYKNIKNNISILSLQVSNSPHKNYFLLIVFTFFSMIFIVGLCCGRVTKRLRRDLKDR